MSWAANRRASAMNFANIVTLTRILYIMAKRLYMLKMQVFVCLILATQLGMAQSNQDADTIRQRYTADQKKIGRAFSDNFYPKFSFYYSLSEKDFVAKIESGRSGFESLLQEFDGKFDAKFVESQRAEIKYYFDKLILDYPSNHYIYTGKKVSLSSQMNRKLRKNLADFNKPEFLANSDFTNYVKAFLSYRVDSEIKRLADKNQDNRRLNAVWQIISTLFTDRKTLDFWRYDYLFNHIDNLGVKNIGGVYENFKAVCQNPAYLSKVKQLYDEDWQGMMWTFMNA
jgi:hypothetical protein